MTKTITFEKIVGGGKALGYLDGKPAFASGPLPGEVAHVTVTKTKSDFLEVSVNEFETTSIHRNTTAEAHYLSCSPWQNVDYGYQLELKTSMLRDAFHRPELDLTVEAIVRAPKQLGYRNKLEFSLQSNGQDLGLAFHDRGSYEGRIAAPLGCALGSDAMNKAALDLAQRAHTLKLDGYIETITVRQSQQSGEIIGQLALHQAPTKRAWGLLSQTDLAGVVVSKLHGRGQHELIWQAGDASLIDVVGGLELEYPYDGFFQTNLEVFEDILRAVLDGLPANGKIIDLYGGVGTIGLAAAQQSREVLGIEINPSSAELAVGNATRAGITNYRALALAAGSLDANTFAATDCVIVDPPRAGLERSVVRALLEAAPAKIIYVSCNPVTQARDVALLSVGYQCSSVTGYDMYPGTLHVESLVILNRR
jgi:23S rRNA (uracil1939-C5)-methyltransferase